MAWLVASLLLLGLGLLAYDYFARMHGTMPPVLEQAPAVTPIADASGEPALLEAYVLALSGDCFFARAADGTTLLVDGGCASDAETILAFLDALGVERLDLVCVTRPVASRIGGLAAIVARYPVGACYLTADGLASPLTAPLLEALAAQDVAPLEAAAGPDSTLDFAAHTELRVLSPHAADYPAAEDRSLMLRLQYGESAILLAGDAHLLAERLALELLPNRLFRADVLLAGDHGDADASGEPFLAAVRPKRILVSTGDGRAPNQAVLDRFTAAGAAVFRTDVDGTIKIVLDGAAATVVE